MRVSHRTFRALDSESSSKILFRANVLDPRIAETSLINITLR